MTRRRYPRVVAFALVAAWLAVVFVSPAAARAQSPCGDRVTVTAGDTLRAIAERCNTTVAAILQANPEITDPSRIRIGAVLAIPSTENGPPPDETEAPTTYTVQRGDWVSTIAQRFDTTVSAILAANPDITDPNRIEVGQEILIPVGAEELNPSVTISPDAGPPSTLLDVTITGYPADTQIVVGIGVSGAEPVTSKTVTSDEQGTATTTIAVPESAQANEQYTVVAYVPGQDGARATSGDFVVASGPDDTAGEGPQETSVRITPTSGASGMEVEVTATGFPPLRAVDIGVGRAGSEYDIVQQDVQTNEQGELTATVTIPALAEAGEEWVVVVTPDGDPFEAISNPFTVLEASERGDGEVTVQISPTNGSPGTRVSLDAAGLPADTTVEIGAGPVDSEYDIIAQAQTNGQGELNRTVPIPNLAEPGEEWVIAVTPQGAPADYISNTFEVTEPSGDEDRNLFTSTNIYLVALEDEGRSGMQIGCGDGVVPVEVQIEPTLAVLTAAMETLVNLDERFHGRSGLYNALYRSDLSVEEVSIEDGEATIRLSGNVSLGGVCDAPRFRAQLRQTALQYFTVDSVSILINGEPLDEVIQ